MAAFRGISHCYQRPTYADWPYSVFTMAHGRSKEECDAVLDSIAAATGIERARDALLEHGVQEGPDALLHRRVRALGSRRRALSTSLSDTRSAELYRRALHVLPGGVNSPVRAMRSIGRDPVFIERAAGADIIDVDGNTYVDYVCSWGPLILGHAHPHVIDAVTAAAALGTSYGAPTAGEVELAELVAQRMPGVEMLRMTSSGTEAAMSAIRLARAATGRETLVKFAGAYHGHVDGLLAEAGSGLATQGIPSSPGRPRVGGPRHRDRAVERRRRRARRASGARRSRRSSSSRTRRTWASSRRSRGSSSGCASSRREHGALLVFDEVITGFRVAPGGAQELTGVIPDLTIMGKVLGGGLPAAAYGGPLELMERIAPAGDVYQAGTLSGNPLAVAAGRATLELLDEDAYVRLAAITEALARGLRAAAGRPRPDRLGARAADGLLQRGARARLRRRRRVRRGRSRRVVPRPARARRLSAAVAVRGVVPLARPYAGAPHAHARGRDGARSRRSRDERDTPARGAAARRGRADGRGPSELTTLIRPLGFSTRWISPR